jgi:DNA-directed RNA polymerase specialized sigma24 family protein
MTDDDRADGIENAFRFARSGDQDAFARWMGMVEIPLRRSLSRFARAVDVEVVVQETFMRMWLFALDHARVLEGDNASLRFVHRVARNVALEEVRRCRQDRTVSLEGEKLDELPEGRIDPPLPDPALGRAIGKCIERLPSQPRTAIMARINEGHISDLDLAEGLRMKVNTFLQNIVRARKLLAACLKGRGISLREVLP